MYLTLDKEKIA